MPEAPARTWLRQAISDWHASERIGDDSDPATFCQIIGKQQQTVEKAVKSILAALRTKSFLKTQTPRGHAVDNEMVHILSAIQHAPRSNRTNTLIHHVQSLFNPTSTQQIAELCALAPKWPSPGVLFPRNTEYPFETATNAWVAPSDGNIFQLSEVRKYRNLANKVVQAAGKIVSAAEK